MLEYVLVKNTTKKPITTSKTNYYKNLCKICKVCANYFAKAHCKKFGEARKCSYLYGVEIKGSREHKVFQGGIPQNTNGIIK
jgi:hypothetical protein